MQKHEYESTPRDCTRNAPSYFTSALGNISGIFYEATIRCCVRPAGGALSRTRRFLCHSPAEAARSASAPTMVATSPPGFVAGRYGKDQMSCVTRKTTIFYHTAIANGKRGIFEIITGGDFQIHGRCVPRKSMSCPSRSGPK